MALQALLFSKSPEPALLLASVFNELGIQAEVCSEIFTAIEKGTKQNFACLIVDWSDQPESSFLLKRARESAANRNAVPIAIVDNEPANIEMRENRLEFLLYRPIARDEARAVLSKACQQMQIHSAALDGAVGGPLDPFETSEKPKQPEDPNLVPIAAEAPKPRKAASEADFEIVESEPIDEEEETPADEEPKRLWPTISSRTICTGLLAVAAVFCLWRARAPFLYLSQTPEGAFHVLRESVAALLYANHSGAQPVHSAVADAQEDAYFARTAPNTHGGSKIGVVAAEATVPESAIQLHKPFDFPLPAPELLRSDPPPMHVQRGPVPESLRHAAPIGPPVIATGPAQIMPVSTPIPRIPQFSEPLPLSEESARGLLLHRVDPVYPPEAAAQKLRGPVVLQATIGRDGRVEDVKIIRGYFLLGRAAAAAVKQWRFQPYSVNGHPAETQTVLTINFIRP